MDFNLLFWSRILNYSRQISNTEPILILLFITILSLNKQKSGIQIQGAIRYSTYLNKFKILIKIKYWINQEFFYSQIFS